jgi:hypothetical protein
MTRSPGAACETTSFGMRYYLTPRRYSFIPELTIQLLIRPSRTGRWLSMKARYGEALDCEATVQEPYMICRIRQLVLSMSRGRGVPNRPCDLHLDDVAPMINCISRFWQMHG